MNPVYEKLVKCYESVRAKTDFEPQVALILGSGLGDYAKNIEGGEKQKKRGTDPVGIRQPDACGYAAPPQPDALYGPLGYSGWSR